jgi:hypothetical protein
VHLSRREIDPLTLRRLYVDEGLVVETVAQRLGCAPTTVLRTLRRFGIPVRPRGPRAGANRAEIRPLDWTPELAWIVGLIATDGNLSRRGLLSIASKDRDLLEVVKHHLGRTKGLVWVTGGYGTCWRLQWGNRVLYAWLTDIGLTPAKSLTLKPLAVPDSVFRDFFRGCLDGDGSIVVYTDRYHAAKCPRYIYERLYVTVVSASRPFLDWLLSTTRRLLGVRGSIRVSTPKPSNPVYAVRFAKRDSIRLLRWIYYRDDLPCLARKRAKALPFLSGNVAGILRGGGVSELVDDMDSKSIARKGVGVQVPSPLPFHHP